MTDAAQDPIRTMSEGAMRHARYALFNELVTGAEMLQEVAVDLRENSRGQLWPDEDTYLPLTWLNDTMEALDALRGSASRYMDGSDLRGDGDTGGES